MSSTASSSRKRGRATETFEVVYDNPAFCVTVTRMDSGRSALKQAWLEHLNNTTKRAIGGRNSANSHTHALLRTSTRARSVVLQSSREEFRHIARIDDIVSSDTFLREHAAKMIFNRALRPCLSKQCLSAAAHKRRGELVLFWMRLIEESADAETDAIVERNWARYVFLGAAWSDLLLDAFENSTPIQFRELGYSYGTNSNTVPRTLSDLDIRTRASATFRSAGATEKSRDTDKICTALPLTDVIRSQFADVD